MKKEFGKWILDVAKYVTTAVIISNLFSDLQGSTFFIVGGACVVFMVIFGLLLTRDNKKGKE